MKLQRSADDKWIAGVAGGLSKELGVDSTIIRIVFAVTSVFWGGGILLYLVLWAVMPRSSGGTIAEDGIKKAQEWNTDRKGRKNEGTTTAPREDAQAWGDEVAWDDEVNPGSDFKI